MDQTETYIKMVDCPEIQALRNKDNWQEGDYYYWPSPSGDVGMITSELYCISGNVPVVWLPRQDDLQGMVIENTTNTEKLGSLLSRFWVFCSCFYQCRLTFEVFPSMEQLWLAFVMKEKYNEVWNGEEWIPASATKQ